MRPPSLPPPCPCSHWQSGRPLCSHRMEAQHLSHQVIFVAGPALERFVIRSDLKHALAAWQKLLAHNRTKTSCHQGSPTGSCCRRAQLQRESAVCVEYVPHEWNACQAAQHSVTKYAFSFVMVTLTVYAPSSIQRTAECGSHGREGEKDGASDHAAAAASQRAAPDTCVYRNMHGHGRACVRVVRRRSGEQHRP
jgi:hypothetical protein